MRRSIPTRLGKVGKAERYWQHDSLVLGLHRKVKGTKHNLVSSNNLGPGKQTHYETEIKLLLQRCVGGLR